MASGSFASISATIGVKYRALAANEERSGATVKPGDKVPKTEPPDARG
jgi:hypothetical protein